MQQETTYLIFQTQFELMKKIIDRKLETKCESL